MKLNVADLIIETEIFYDFTKNRLAPYVYRGEKPADFSFSVSQNCIADTHGLYPHLTLGECEAIKTADAFYTCLTRFGGLMLHSSAVVCDGKAYLFSAPSGTGKSTHTHLWLQEFPGTYILNDDKPAIRKKDGVFCAYGTPWSGKTDESRNEGVPIGGIIFLSRADSNSIKRADSAEVLKDFMDQTVRPKEKADMLSLLTTLDTVLTEVPVYKLFCNPTPEAAHIAHDTLI